MTDASPRIMVLGDACGFCSQRISPGDFLFRVQSMTFTGYLHTEMCFVCLLKFKGKELSKYMKEKENAAV
jgi:hypothetical protein